MARDRPAVPRWALAALGVLVVLVLAVGLVVSRQSSETQAANTLVTDQRDAAAAQVLSFAAQVRQACATGVLPPADPLCDRAVQVQADPIPATAGRDGTNGTDGVNGIAGLTPPCYFTASMCQGRDGRNGVDGTNGLNGTDGADGQPGKDGTNGRDGLNGCDAGQVRDQAGVCVPAPSPPGSTEPTIGG